MTDKKDKFIIIDGNALMHRAWHALPPLATKKGELINAVYGFTMILLRVLKDLKPEYAAVTFDLAAPTFRHQEFKDYKATRVKQPDELYEQIPKIKEVVKAFKIPIYEKEGFEADDVIGTLVKEKSVQDLKTIIVTGDLDTLQLVDDNTEVYTMHKGVSESMVYNVAEVARRFEGLTPAQMIDFKALKGDPSDNIPGVRGVGEKTAINLIKEFGTLENVYKNLDSPKIKLRYQKLLKEHRAEAALSKKLATIVTDVPLKFQLQDVKIVGCDPGVIIPLFQKLEFKSLLPRLPKEMQSRQQTSLNFGPSGEGTGNRKQGVNYQLIDTEVKFQKFITELKNQPAFAFDTETNSLDPLTARLLGISFCWQAGTAYFLPTGEMNARWLALVKPILENPQLKKYGHNLKFDIESLATVGITVWGLAFDTMVASYLTNPGSRQHNLDNLAFTEFGYQAQPITDLIGKGKNQTSLAEVPLERVSDYSCEDADFSFQLVSRLTKELKEKNNLDLLQKIEMPLIPVLAAMETAGIKIDVEFLNKISGAVSQQIQQLETEIHRLAKAKFNISSPLQLKEVLFEKLKISPLGLGHTKTGISTAADELQKLKTTHKIIPRILQYRELTKLKSTYLEALPQLVSRRDGRVHTSFNQTITATGRLSSSEPNLQNIPVRTELGQKIRRAFIAESSFLLLSADYSQIELRLVASLANDSKMIAAFNNNEDIHARTAAEINEISQAAVTPQQRRAAKAVNFGIIYGMGAAGLASQEGITVERAREFIDKYFAIHKNIKDYLENTKELARTHGFVETIFGRRRYLPEINSGVQNIRAAAERMATNHPIQGSCADLIKLAMIEIHAGLPKISPASKMILQVHDELVFEVPAADIPKVAKFVKDKMEGIYKLRVPIKAGVEAGESWGELYEIKI